MRTFNRRIGVDFMNKSAKLTKTGGVMNNSILTKIVTLCLCMSVLVFAEKSGKVIKGDKGLADTREQMINNNTQEKMELEGITPVLSNELKVVNAAEKKAADKKEAAYRDASYRAKKEADQRLDKEAIYLKGKKEATYREAIQAERKANAYKYDKKVAATKAERKANAYKYDKKVAATKAAMKSSSYYMNKKN